MDEPYVTAEDIGKALSFSADAIRRLSRRKVNPMPALKIGGWALRFRLSDVLSWAESDGLGAPQSAALPPQVARPARAKKGPKRKGEPDLSLRTTIGARSYV